ncbi:ISNCY family transposase [Candidatus Micrarchaeota archaeon]|nr:ISNCY family transposase [Candidatus Micrarchaeota archaeon]
MRITNKELGDVLQKLDDIIEEYKANSVEKKRDWRTYELQLAERIRFAMRQLDPLIDEAIGKITIVRGESRGRKPELSVKQKTSLLLLKHLFGKSNREMSLMLVVFSLLSDIDVSYKTVERLYSDPEVLMVLHNMHVLMMKKRNVTNPDCTGDGTGYSLSITTHYATEAQKLKDKAKENEPQAPVSIENTGDVKDASEKEAKKRKRSAFAFMFMDLRTRMYVGFGSSFKSEKQAFLKALAMAHETGMNSIRMDKYYSAQTYATLMSENFPDIKLYFIPKSNATIEGPWSWKRMLYDFVNATPNYLHAYFGREQSESGIGEDKNRVGWTIAQRRDDRIDTAVFCTGTWHNLFWLKET